MTRSSLSPDQLEAAEPILTPRRSGELLVSFLLALRPCHHPFDEAVGDGGAEFFTSLGLLGS